MSWNYCAISGEQLSEPVVSRKTGHVFEKSVITKYVSSTGQCPLTGQALSNDDLLPINLSSQTKPRSVTLNSVPGILKVFQSEWDALMLEGNTQKQQLESVRQELSHALYQHDAACRVIARLIQERDDARREAASLQDRLRDQKGSSQMEEETDEISAVKHTKLPQEIINSIAATAQQLSTERKDRKKDTEFNNRFASEEIIGNFSQKESVNLHSTTTPGILSLDLSRENNLAISGGKDGSIVVFDLIKQEVQVQTDQFSGKPVFGLSVLRSNEVSVSFVALTRHSLHALDYSIVSKTFTEVYQFSFTSSISALATHPNGSLIIVANKEGVLSFHDVKSGTLSLEVDDFRGKSQIHSLQVHPDGNLLAIGCADGSTKLWNIASSEVLTSFEDNINGPVDLVSFSETGLTLALGSSLSKVVKIFNLRKAKCVKTLFGESEEAFSLSSIQFDRAGAVLAVGSTDGKINLLDTKKWETISSISAHSQSVNALRFTEFSKQLISISTDRSLKMFA